MREVFTREGNIAAIRVERRNHEGFGRGQLLYRQLRWRD